MGTEVPAYDGDRTNQMKHSGPLPASFYWVLSLCVLAVETSGAEGNQTIHSPYLVVRGEYDNNVDFSKNEKKEDYISSIRLGLNSIYRKQTASVFSRIELGLINNAYYNYRNRQDYFFDISADIMPTEKSSCQLKMTYAKDQTLENELKETGLVTGWEDRQRYSGGGGFRYRLTERIDTGLMLNGELTEYASELNFDHSNVTVSLTGGYRAKNGRDVFGCRPYFRRYHSKVFASHEYGFYLGQTRSLTEQAELSVHAGARYTTGDLSRSAQGAQGHWGALADVSLKQTGQAYCLAAGYTRNMAYSSQGELVEVDKVFATADTKMTEHFDLGLSVGYYLSRSGQSPGTTNSRYLECTPSLAYRLGRHHVLRAGYTLSHRYEGHAARDRGYGRNRFWVMITLEFPQGF